MSTHIKQVYPSRDNGQRTGDDEIPFRAAFSMLQTIVNNIPEGERDSARITGWKSLRLVHDHTDSAQEVAEKRVSLLMEMIQAGRDGLTKEEVAVFADRLAAV